MHESRDRVVRGHPKPHSCNQRPQFSYSLYKFYGATMSIKGSLKQFLAENFPSPVKIGPKIAVFRE